MALASTRITARRGVPSPRRITLGTILCGTFLVLAPGLIAFAIVLTRNAADTMSDSMTGQWTAWTPSLGTTPVVDATATTATTPTHAPRTHQPVTIAYAISLIKCGDFQSSTEGMMDAAIVLQHSVHQTSVRAGKSAYDYKMYAIVHRDALHCSQPLADVGYERVVRDTPVNVSDIRDSALRKGVHRAWCCGADEFVKLYAYTIPEALVVHVDVDFVMVQPMDDLFDAMLYGDSAAVQRIPRERPNDPWPTNPQAAMTRDWGQVMPGRKPGYQAGFLVVKPNQTVFEEIVNVILNDDYNPGYGRDCGWGSKGYGVFVGAMAMQGLMAYYYDIYQPNTWVELNQCRFNHMGMDVLYRSQPNFQARHAKRGMCRNDLDYCEDCQTTAMENIYNIHYTQCRKPWNCIGEGLSTNPDKSSIPEDSVVLSHCMELQSVWHGHRRDLERALAAHVGTEDNKRQKETASIVAGQAGDYKKEVFQGHCRGNGQTNYLALAGGQQQLLLRIPELYQ